MCDSILFCSLVYGCEINCMDGYHQLGPNLVYIEDAYLSISAAMLTHGLTVMDVLVAAHGGVMDEMARKVGHTLSELTAYAEALKQQLAVLPEKPPQPSFIPTGIDGLDEQLEGGVPRGLVTEIVGASGCGKSQLLVQLAVQAQRDGERCIYISTESGLETRRLRSIIEAHDLPALMDLVDVIHCEDMEAQNHILFTQLPLLLRESSVAAVMIDSISHHVRSESFADTLLDERIAEQETQLLDTERSTVHRHHSQLKRFFRSDKRHQEYTSKRQYLYELHSHLSSLAVQYNLAVVVANQVADQPDVEVEAFEPDPLLYHYQLGAFAGWDPKTTRQLQRTLIEDPKRQRVNQAKTIEANSVSILGSDLQPVANQDGLSKTPIDKPTQAPIIGRRIVPALGIEWSRHSQCRIVLQKRYRPIGSDQLDGWQVERTARVVYKSPEKDSFGSPAISFVITNAGLA